MIFDTAFLLLGLLGSATAVRIPNVNIHHAVADVPDYRQKVKIMGFDCFNRVKGLSARDCEHMVSIGMAGQGDNQRSNNGNIWIGKDGPNLFTFRNTGTGAPVNLIIWDFPANDYVSSFMNVRRPKISYSLNRAGESVTVSIANGVSGGFSFLANRQTTLSPYGQISNTWGEFTTGPWGTADVSRLVNMAGDAIDIRVRANGCVSNMDRCSFQCKQAGASSCGESGTYSLVNCDNGSQPGASYGTYDGINPEGGCQGFSNGGRLDISLTPS